eukprot:g694.t1 g694   contig10:548545-549093(+)
MLRRRRRDNRQCVASTSITTSRRFLLSRCRSYSHGSHQAFEQAKENKGKRLLIKEARARKASNSAKQKDSKRDTVPFHEMERLMKVYGPTKCLRNRSKTTEKEPKADSVRRKFYRWFPDFEERFIKTDAGWYIAKIGHEEEVAWRAEMRKADQDDLVQKRQARRISKWGISGVKLDGSCKLV